MVHAHHRTLKKNEIILCILDVERCPRHPEKKKQTTEQYISWDPFIKQYVFISVSAQYVNAQKTDWLLLERWSGGEMVEMGKKVLYFYFSF